MRMGFLAGAAAAALVVAGCGSGSPSPQTAQSRSQAPAPSPPAALVREARPIGRGPRFDPPARGPDIGPCQSELGARFGVHVEVFAANRVVVIARGIGTRPPLQYSAGRISKARCYGALVTLEPTGVVLVRQHARLDLADLFRAWGEPVSAHALTSFTGPVRVYVAGHRRLGPPGRVALTPDREIVLEIGPYVPPHSRYTFPPAP